MCTHTFCRSDNRTEIVGICHPVQNNDKGRFALFTGSFQDILHRAVLIGRSKCDQALMPRCNLVQAALVHGLDHDFLFLGFLDNLQGRSGQVTLLDHQFLQVPMILQRFADRIPAGQDILFRIGILLRTGFKRRNPFAAGARLLPVFIITVSAVLPAAVPFRFSIRERPSGPAKAVFCFAGCRRAETAPFPWIVPVFPPPRRRKSFPFPLAV